MAARAKARVVALDTSGNVRSAATIKFYEPGTASVSGSSTTGTPFAASLYAAISGGSPISTTQTADSYGTVTVFTDTPSRFDVGIEASGGARVTSYESMELDPAEVLRTSTDGSSGGSVAAHGTSGGFRVYDRASPYSAYHEIYNTGGVFGLYSSALAGNALTVSAAGLMSLAGTGQALAALTGDALGGNLPVEGGTSYDRVGISQGSASPSPSSHAPMISVQRVASHNAPVRAQSADYYFQSTRYGRASVARATATGGSSTTVVKSGAGWSVNAFVGHQVDLLVSTGITSIQRGIVASNTSDTITISGTFGQTPVAGTEFVVNAGGSIDLYVHTVYAYDDNRAMPADVRPSTIAVSGFSKQAANSTATTFGALFLGEMDSTNGNSIGVEIDIVNNAGTAATYPTVTGNLQTIGLNIASFCSDAGYAGTYNSLGILLQSSGPNSAMRTGILFGGNSALTYGIDFKPLTAGSTTPKPIRLGSGHQIVGRNAADNADVAFLAWEIDDTVRLRSTNGTMFESNAGTEWARINSGGLSFAAAALVQTTTSAALTLKTNSTTRMELQANGDVTLGTAALATNATAGWLFLTSSAGAPSGTPTTYTGRVPVQIDTTNGRLYAYYGGAWHYVALT